MTSRLGQPHVNQRAALRAADLVIMIDAFSDVGPPGDTTLDVAVRGAAGLATAYLRTGDRVGVVVLGGVLKWLAPSPGNRQFFRIVEMAFGVRFASEANPDLDRVPRTALPPRALVVLFSPLLDRRALNAVTDLRQRGVSLVIVDVLTREPPAEPRLPMSQLAVRLWRLDRERAAVQPHRPGCAGAELGQRDGPRRRAGGTARPANPGGAVMSTPDRGTRSARPPRLADVITRAVTGCLGAGMIILPAPQLTGRSWALLPIGLLLVAVSLAGPLARWRVVGTLAAATAVIESALTRPDLAVLAWRGPADPRLPAAGGRAAGHAGRRDGALAVAAVAASRVGHVQPRPSC